MTVEGLYDDVREALGDTEEPGGGIFNNQRLPAFYKRAYKRLFAALKKGGYGPVQKIVYYNLPVRTTILTPSQLGVTDFGRPAFLRERGGLTTNPVTAASAASPVVLTSAGHPFSTDDLLFIANVGPESNGRWFGIKVDANSFSLNGSSSSTARSGLSGTATKSSEGWTDVVDEAELGWLPSDRSADEYLRTYIFRDGAIQFVGSTEIRQLEVGYVANGSAPLTGDIGIEHADNFLTAYTAGRAAQSFDRPSQGEELLVEAEDYLEILLDDLAKGMQRKVYRPKSRLRRIPRR